MAFEDAVNEVSLVKAAIGPFVASSAVFLALKVLSFELNLALVPGLLAETMLLVVHPFAFVGGSLGVDESAAAVGHAVQPLALVDATVSLDHATEPLHHIHDELALVLGAVLPDKDTESVLDLASVDVAPVDTPTTIVKTVSGTNEEKDRTERIPCSKK